MMMGTSPLVDLLKHAAVAGSGSVCRPKAATWQLQAAMLISMDHCRAEALHLSGKTQAPAASTLESPSTHQQLRTPAYFCASLG
jgi:hypothetical protein